jgi:hypothetical protein
MRWLALVIALLASSAWAADPPSKCFGTQAVSGLASTAAGVAVRESTDVFRFDRGQLFHASADRSEYLYNTVVVAGSGRFASGFMTFVLNADGTAGYVSIAGDTDWRLVYLRCER